MYLVTSTEYKYDIFKGHKRKTFIGLYSISLFSLLYHDVPKFSNLNDVTQSVSVFGNLC